ncbi:GNAT family acetyltransferase [Pseudalgibacter alginicilyticus]|uniref:GNAT family acetyltransferase n=1 Tax=Pseudalgibacter alginicilyticus TaxID=1736674 RepID=A0A0P0D9R8_9FLAO|nr:GNAT family N-acetyltransferase [Pseudalgibacter alginicilyticus]ALJ05612.1 GNAT family acetyltransferase [Pseudalgibacter alginicilyticus]
MLKIEIKTFSELTKQELYNILQLRSEVFVVEQNSIYQDVDGKDQKALHILGFKNDKLIAYTRIFKPGDYFEKSSIGRVVVAKNNRQFNYGNEIMNASINAVKTIFKVDSIHISAQAYLKRFYNNLGFKEIGEEYLEDGIPHIAMIKES